jgi:hypothetical protein
MPFLYCYLTHRDLITPTLMLTGWFIRINNIIKFEGRFGMKNTGTSFLFIPLILMSVVLAPNCATIIQRSMQRIPVTSSPVGAAVIVDGQKQGVTPLDIYLSRQEKGQVIRIESPGYNSFEIHVKRRLSGAPILGNVLLGGLAGLSATVIYGLSRGIFWGNNRTANLIFVVGGVASFGVCMLIDAAGKGYTRTPTELTVTLTKVDGPPRVDMVLVDAGDFRNVKWIRIRKD